MEKINICRPGFGASCALCCGSHNFRGTREDIETAFGERTYIFKTRHRMTGNSDLHEKINALFHNKANEKEIDEGIQCPYVGFSGTNGEIGCLAYNDQGSFSDIEGEFFRTTCKNFSCRARDELTAGEIRFAAELMRDWYFYGLLIHKIPLLRGLMRTYGISSNVSDDERVRIQGMLQHALQEVLP